MKNYIYRPNFFLSSAFAGILLSLFLFASNTAIAVTGALNEQQIRKLFNKAVKISGTVGAQLSIIKDGQQLDFTYGLANAELNIPMTQDTIIQIGSTTKIFNAMVVMTLVEEGLLDLDTPVIKYIPEFKVADPLATQTVTLRQLLSMSSGLDNGDYAEHGPGDDALAKYVASLKTLPQHFPPGSAFGYSNAGTDIAGYVAQRVTGLYWDDLLMERILKPAGLKNAVTRARDRVYQRISVGHTVDPQSGDPSVIRPWSISRGHGPAGSTLSISAHDLARFGKLFLNEGVADTGKQILSKEGIQTMMTPQIDLPMHFYANAWGIGPSRNEWEGVTLWGHGGSNLSGRSYLHWIPEKNAVIAFMVNTPAARDRFMKVMFKEVTKVAFGISKPNIDKPSQPLTIPNPERYVGTYEQVNGICVIEAVGNRLIKRIIYNQKEVDQVALIPLGGDRFLIDRGEKADPLTMLEDTAFFGRDKKGRATNMLNVVFPLSRKTDGGL